MGHKTPVPELETDMKRDLAALGALSGTPPAATLAPFKNFDAHARYSRPDEIKLTGGGARQVDDEPFGLFPRLRASVTDTNNDLAPVL